MVLSQVPSGSLAGVCFGNSYLLTARRLQGQAAVSRQAAVGRQTGEGKQELSHCSLLELTDM